jgi:hypothetical protein
MKAAFFLFLSFISICVFSQGSITLQDKPFVYKETIDTSIWNRLVSDPIFKGLSERDQQMFYWVNVFRKNPKRFYETTIREFVRQFPEANRKEVKSLEKDISKIDGPLPLFIPDAGLVRMSSIHCNDLKSRGGVISHKSSSGKDFGQRIKEAGSYRCGAENIFIGTDGSLEALIMLLVDYGVPEKGHRLNLLDPSFERMGISSSRVAPKKTIIVQEFACK